MTTLQDEIKVCAICGNVSNHKEILSTKALGSSDLDARPPEPERSSITYWIQRCPVCGYCAPDLARGDTEMANIIESDPYKAQLRDSEKPNLANSFLCWSMILEDEAQFRIAGWTVVKASWACDDAGNDQAARQCRKRAVVLLQTAREKGQWFADNASTEEAIIVDLLRRSSEFDEALKICDDRLQKRPDKLIHDILVYQKELIRNGDTKRHAASEITDHA